VLRVLSSVDKVNALLLTVANAGLFTKDVTGTRKRLIVLIKSQAPSLMAEARASLKALDKEVGKKASTARVKIRSALATLLPAASKAFDGYATGKVDRPQLVALSKKMTQATHVVRKLLEKEDGVSK